MMAEVVEGVSPLDDDGSDGTRGQGTDGSGLGAPPARPEPTRSPIGVLFGAAAAGLAAMMGGAAPVQDDVEEDDEGEDEEGAGLQSRSMPKDYDGGKLFLTWCHLGPLGKKYPVYQNAGSYDGAKPLSREQQHKAKRKLQPDVEASGGSTISVAFTPTQPTSFASTYQQEVAVKKTASENYAFDSELNRLEMLVRYCPPDMKEQHQQELYEFAKSRSVAAQQPDK